MRGRSLSLAALEQKAAVEMGLVWMSPSLCTNTLGTASPDLPAHPIHLCCSERGKSPGARQEKEGKASSAFSHPADAVLHEPQAAFLCCCPSTGCAKGGFLFEQFPFPSPSASPSVLPLPTAHLNKTIRPWMFSSLSLLCPRPRWRIRKKNPNKQQNTQI